VTQDLSEKNEHLHRIEKHVGILDPVNILKRGFSITLHNGKAVKRKDEVREGETITTILADGAIESVVTDAIKSKDND
jgi:exodeoxyribonuclease VII large subunit